MQSFLKVSGQNDSSAIKSMFSNYQNTHKSEKLFVHTDKELFVAGEILWFKIYAVDASSLASDELSKIAYVELLDSLNKPVLQAKIGLINSAGTGSFYLPLILNSGYYRLRTYTSWMQNFDAAYYFEKSITIINVQKNTQFAYTFPSRIIKADFFPEGGNIIDNLPCKVGFKVTDKYGNGIDCKGFLLDGMDTVLTFTTLHAGMGSFVFTPVSNHFYRAFIKTDSGEVIVKNLPPTYANGYAMHVSDSVNKITVTVWSGDKESQPIYLFVHTRGLLRYGSAARWLMEEWFLFLKNL